MRIDNAHTALVYTVAPKTLSQLMRQRVRWVSGFLKNAYHGYRHMMLSAAHGNLGVLTLPFAFISIFIALYFSAYYFSSIFSFIYDRYLEYSAIGIRFSFGWPNFDWFAMNLEWERLIVYIILAFTVFFAVAGAKIAGKKRFPYLDFLFFALFYSMIAPLWLARSVYLFAARKGASWR